MVMIFSSEKAMKELIDSGIVYTFRVTDLFTERKLGKEWVTYKRGGKKVADVLISLATRHAICPSELQLFPYAPYSGFESVEEWATEIKRVNKIDPDFGLLGNIFCVNMINWNEDLVSKYINGELK